MAHPAPHQHGTLMNPRRLFSTAALFSLLLGATPVRAERLYVSEESTGHVVSYDISLADSAAVLASKQVFASTNLYRPYGLTFDSAGNLYVANTNSTLGDAYANTISKFDSSGSFVLSMSRPGWINPYDVALDAAENLYVGSDNGTTGYSIVKFDRSGNFLGYFGANPNPSIPAASGLAFDNSGSLYVTSYDDDAVRKFDATGSLVSSITTGISGPYDITFAAGSLYVGNSLTEVTKYSTTGSLEARIGSEIYPLGVAVDASGNVYASNGDAIFKFNSAGGFQFSWATPGISTYMTVAAVPEPSTYVMALAGIACGGFSMWRRRKRA